jgi:anaerobic ribonucleoside-triphosphate reductase activating protein
VTGQRPLRLHAFEPCSAVNGPGIRAVVWVQGCTLGCPGCFNPSTHPRPGTEVAAADLAGRILALGDRIEGVTISGGEPLQQRGAVLQLLRALRARTALSAILLTGYRFAELTRMPEAAELTGLLDVLIAGRYEQTLRLGRGLRGSANKTVHLLTGRYTLADLDRVPDAEVIIGPGGRLTVSGIDPPVLGPPVPGAAAR